ncbi:tRNA pseudouridine(55) synthase TruB [Fibrobacter sp. UWB2]|uniref:tRNA pseudouridine(55) synthase TruB n=1 Tax=Fibrobacter sp. UWB2 TaxID=1964358 RepID=UPI000B527867|nr:tRNA pseudouridine(55) synthase TruB [Fibrobacter sp. UWB2]OWV22412.1 tRNA pseudouridine(55) synthase TruB [Fibrobacter sp. UWB2]
MSSSGFVLLDKIAGETSFKALFPLKRVFCTKRVGHAGTLDLRASGLIIAATGRATRLLPYIEAKDKCYTFRLHLGYETDTLEWDGEVVEQDDRSLSVTRADLEAVLPQFIGDIDQVPPNYSAVKIDGHRASDLANRGREIELKPRRIHIESLKVVGEGLVTEGCTGKSFATFDLECNCSKGTYIRSLGRDLARALGTCGCVSMIRRHRIGDVTVDRAVRGDALTPEHLLPVDQVLDFPVVRLNDDQVKAIRLGNWVPWRTPVENLSTTPGAEKFVFTADKDGAVIGLGVYDPGRICPKFFLGDD